MNSNIIFASILGAALGFCIWRIEVLFKRDHEEQILAWLRANPGWHYGLDLVAAGLAGRSSIYIYLHRLEDKGLVMRMVGAKTHPGLPRALYRAMPDEGAT